MNRSNRSDRYQHLLLEKMFPSEMLEGFSNDDSIHKRLNPFAYNEEVFDLEEELKVEFWRIVNDNLTERQKEVIRLSASGLTQQEIAAKLNVNQSSITKSLNGNVDYKNGRRIYGGSTKKLQKIIEKDEKIKTLLAKISALRDDGIY